MKKTYYNFNADTTVNKTSNNYFNDTYNVIKTVVYLILLTIVCILKDL